MREIVLDTETTGLSPSEGHRIIEIGCVELKNHVPTSQVFHVYVNPRRDVPEEASAISGLTTEFLKDKSFFEDIVEDFLNFISDSPLIIHNAKFDMGFLNAELSRLQRSPLPAERAIDTLEMARRKFPGSPASLDALCKRFQIDLRSRDKHGALIDAHLLSQVYVELKGGRQQHLLFQAGEWAAPTEVSQAEENASPKGVLSSLNFLKKGAAAKKVEARPHEASSEEKKAHQNLLDQIKNPLWLRLESLIDASL